MFQHFTSQAAHRNFFSPGVIGKMMVGLLFILSPLFLSAQIDLRFNKVLHDFGELHQGASSGYDFIFRNAGSEGLRIKTARANDPQVQVVATQSEVLPGEYGFVKIKLDSLESEGFYTALVTVTMKAGEREVSTYLNLKARVLPGKGQTKAVDPFLVDSEISTTVQVDPADVEVMETLRGPDYLEPKFATPETYKIILDSLLLTRSRQSRRIDVLQNHVRKLRSDLTQTEVTLQETLDKIENLTAANTTGQLKEELESWQEKARALEAEKEMARVRWKNLDKDLQAAQANHLLLEQSLAEQEQQIADLTREKENARKEAENLSLQLEERFAREIELQEENADLVEMIQKSDQALNQAQANLDAQEHKLTATRQESEAMSQKAHAAQLELEVIQQNLLQVSSERDAKQTELTSLQTDLEKANNLSNDLAQQLSDAEAQQKSLEEKITLEQKARVELEVEAKTLLETDQKQKEEFLQLEEKITDLEAQLSDKNRVTGQLEQDLEASQLVSSAYLQLQEQLESEMRNRAQLESAIKLKTDSLIHFRQRVAGLENDLSGWENKDQAKETQLLSLEKDLEELRVALEKRNSKSLELEASLAELRQKNQQLEQDYRSGLQESNSAQAQKLLQRENELSAITRKLEEQQEIQEKLNLELQTAQESQNSLTASLQIQTDSLTFLQKRLQEYDSQMIDLHASNQHKETEIEKLEKELGSLTQSLKEKTELAREQENLLAQKEEALSRAQESLEKKRLEQEGLAQKFESGDLARGQLAEAIRKQNDSLITQQKELLNLKRRIAEQEEVNQKQTVDLEALQTKLTQEKLAKNDHSEWMNQQKEALLQAQFEVDLKAKEVSALKQEALDQKAKMGELTKERDLLANQRSTEEKEKLRVLQEVAQLERNKALQIQINAKTKEELAMARLAKEELETSLRQNEATMKEQMAQIRTSKQFEEALLNELSAAKQNHQSLQVEFTEARKIHESIVLKLDNKQKEVDELSRKLDFQAREQQQLQETLASRESEVAQYRELLLKQESQVHNLTEALQKEAENYRLLESQLQDKIREQESLSNQLTRSKTQTERQSKEITDLQQSLTASRNAKASVQSDLQEEIKAKEALETEHQKEMTLLELEVDALKKWKEDNLSYKSQVLALEKKVAELQLNVQRTESEKGELESQLNLQRQEVTAAKNRIGQLHSELKAHQQDQSASEFDRSSLLEELESAKAREQTALDQAKTLEEKIGQHDASLDQKNREVSTLQQELNKSQNLAKNLKTQLEAIEVEQESDQTTQEKQAEELRQLKAELLTDEAIIQKQNQQLSTLREELQQEREKPREVETKPLESQRLAELEQEIVRLREEKQEAVVAQSKLTAEFEKEKSARISAEVFAREMEETTREQIRAKNEIAEKYYALKLREGESTSESSAGSERVYYRIQVLIADEAIPLDSPRFLGHNDVKESQTEGKFKYTIGKVDDYQAAKAMKTKLKNDGFEYAFVVAFKGKERISIQEALEAAP